MKKICFLLIVMSAAYNAPACTSFLLEHQGHYYFGRNYDWVTGNGMLMTNPRNTSKYAAADSTLRWTSTYGSISFNQYGKEFPTGGMNEKGLVVELMWLEETVYPKADQRPAIGVLQWIQYQLDNSATVDDVIASDARIRIGEKDNTPLHYLVADAKGQAAAIEFLDGKMVVHRRETMPFPVLTNSTYAASVKQTTISKNNTGFTDNSLQRFAKACSMIGAFRNGVVAASPVPYAFSILSEVAQAGHTRWSIVYDISSLKIYFITDKNRETKYLSFSDLSLECSQESLATDLNTAGSGDLKAKMTRLSYDANARMVATSASESAAVITISKESVDKTAAFFGQIGCDKRKN